MTVSSVSVSVEENEVIRLVLEFLTSRKLHKSTRNLERESGITNCRYSENVLFLRQLILDGEWDAILTFIQPLEKIDGFDVKRFRYLVLKEKFMEILYFKSGIEGVCSNYSIDDMIKCLNQLEKDCSAKSEYTKLCWLLTVPDLYEQPEYQDWNPETARIKCFGEVIRLLKDIIPLEKNDSSNKQPHIPAQNRLVTLVVKGLCFESCVDYCHERAVNGDLDRDITVSTDIISGTNHDSTGNFLSWLHSLPQESFAAPFEPVSLKVDLQSSSRNTNVMLFSKTLQNEAESLSRSLSISGRPSSAVQKVRDAPESLDDVRKVSSSYSNFHYTQPSKGFRPIHPDGKNVKGAAIEPLNEADTCKDAVSNSKETDGCDSTDVNTCESPHVIENTTAVHGTEAKLGSSVAEKGVHDSQDSLDRLKRNQENIVLKQLEEHEKQQSELRRQLMENSNMQGVPSETTPHQEQVDEPSHIQGSPKINGPCNGHKSSKELSKTSTSPNISNKSSHDNCYGSSSRMQRKSPVGKEMSPCFKDNTDSQPKPPKQLTSTPLAKKKPIPEPLKLDNVSVSNIEGINQSLYSNLTEINEPHTGKPQAEAKDSTASQFPKTPKANMLPPGHWVALADGSSVLNTSTPKSCRLKMSNTPAPPESPVNITSAVNTDGQGNVQDVAETKDEQAPSTNDKGNPAVADPPSTRRGPKINGVRRTLVSSGPPMPRNKGTVTPTEEMREAKTPRQDNPSGKTNTKNQGSAGNSPRSVNQQYGAVKKTSREETSNVKPKTGGNTFVVDNASQEVAAKIENKNGDVKQGVTNLTYNKPSNSQPTSTMNQQQKETSKLMERQREYMKSNADGIQFCTVASLEDAQAIRAVTFHPSGDLFAIGSNSKTLRVCAATGLNTYKKVDSSEHLVPPQPTILFKHNRHHRGTIYCVAWNNAGDMIATGSNDKTIKVLHFDADNCTQIGPEMELNIHSGTVRDVAFAPRTGGTTVLVSGGAGSGNIQITDCSTGNTIGQLKGHSGHVMSIFAAKDDIIASGSNDNTVRLWDLRSQRCIDAIATGDSCVASVCMNATGTLLSSGHEDGGCMIYDITAGRTLQFFKPHTLDCRSVRFSPDGNHLLTASYDTSIILIDMQHNLDYNIPPYSVVAQHRDKVIQCRWHPHVMAFVSSSADKTACLWTLDC